MIAVGVDAGGTATVAAISSAGRLRRTVTGARANPTTAGVAAAATAIVATIRSGLDGDEPAAIHVGAAGGARPDVARALTTALALEFPAARIVVGHDAAIALRSAVADGPGIALVAGTGSCAYAEGNGTTALVGGHGYVIGDEGSAFAVGLAAVRHYARMLDGRAGRDETSDLVARTFAATDRAGFHRALYDRPLEPATVAALAPSILAFAGKGNRVATKIVQEAAKELGDLVRAAARGANLTDATVPIVLAGGLLRENSLLTFLLETRLTGDFTGAALIRGAEPVAGALRLAEWTAAQP